MYFLIHRNVNLHCLCSFNCETSYEEAIRNPIFQFWFKQQTQKNCQNSILTASLWPGSVLLSQRVAPSLSSALKSLTSVFGMGTGGTSSLSSPDFGWNRLIIVLGDNISTILFLIGNCSLKTA